MNWCSQTLWGHETPIVHCTFVLPVLETLYTPEQIITSPLHLLGTIILRTKGTKSVTYIWQEHSSLAIGWLSLLHSLMYTLHEVTIEYQLLYSLIEDQEYLNMYLCWCSQLFFHLITIFRLSSYNNTLMAALDKHVPLMTRTIVQSLDVFLKCGKRL